MQTKNWFPTLFAAALLALSLLACGLPTPTPPGPPVTITPFSPATAVSPTRAVEPTVGAPTAVPTEAPLASWLPENTFALYTSGSWESRRLYALSPGPTSTDLGQPISYQAAVSRRGRWIATTEGASPARTIAITSLENGTRYTYALPPDFESYGMAFDHAETRLALMELGPFGPDGVAWAIVVVNLADGSTTRFATVMGPERDFLPGRPIGWSAPGNELLLNTFMPATEGNWAGVWAVTLPPGAPPAPLDTLARRELIPMGSYYDDPRLSPDATHLLYLNRDFAYTPAGYEPMAYDLAVNELWSVDIASGARTILVNVTDGGALARAVSWSPENPQALFVRVSYAGETFTSLALKRRDEAGTVHDAGSLSLPAGGGLQTIDWCLPDFALVTITDASYNHQLQVAEFGGGSTLITSAEYISVLGCIP